MLKNRPLIVLFAGVCLAMVAGCEPEIGDECELATECSQNGERLCLTESQEGFPGGYCTLFNCDPGGCPEEAICVAYRAHLGQAGECRNPFERPRLQRSWCMLSCSSNADCRSGYECIDPSHDGPWGAEILESPGTSGKVCALAYLGPDPAEEHQAELCASNLGNPSEGSLLTPLGDSGSELDAAAAQTKPSDAGANLGDAAEPDAASPADASGP